MGVACHINKKIAENPIDRPRRNVIRVRSIQDVKSQLQFIYSVGSSFVDARGLTGWADENPGEQIRERRMIQPVPDKTPEQVRAPKKWTVRWRNSAKSQMITAACSRMPPVEHEFFRREPAQPGLFVELDRILDKFAPTRCRMNVDFDHARIGSDLDYAQSGIGWRLVPFNEDRYIQQRRRLFERGDQFDVIFR